MKKSAASGSGLDSFICSQNATEEEIFRRLEEGEGPGALTLFLYLYRCVALGYLPDSAMAVVNKLLHAGAAPWIMNGDEALLRFAGSHRLRIPHALRSTLNLAVLLGSASLVSLLLRCGDRMNKYTLCYVNRVEVCRLLLQEGARPTTIDFKVAVDAMLSADDGSYSHFFDILLLYLRAGCRLDTECFDLLKAEKALPYSRGYDYAQLLEKMKLCKSLQISSASRA